MKKMCFVLVPRSLATSTPDGSGLCARRKIRKIYSTENDIDLGCISRHEMMRICEQRTTYVPRVMRCYLSSFCMLEKIGSKRFPVHVYFAPLCTTKIVRYFLWRLLLRSPFLRFASVNTRNTVNAENTIIHFHIIVDMCAAIRGVSFS